MKRFQNILVAVDSRQDKHPALQWAARLAEHNQAKLRIVDVLPDLSWIAKLVLTDSEKSQEALAEQKRRMLQTVAEPIRAQGVEVTTELLFGKTSFAIMHEVLRSGHDLVVRVTKGAHSGRTGFFGTTSMRLLRKCPCAVWLVRGDTEPRFSRVLAAVDPAPHDDAREIMNKTIMDLGQSIAEYEKGQFHVVHAWKLGSGDESWLHPDQLEETVRKVKMEGAAALDNFLAPYKLSHRGDSVHLLHDEIGPGHAISELAKKQDVDLIVMGTIARTGVVGALMGNTAEQVIDRIECSVLAVKPDDFVSPVTLPDV